MPAWTDRHSSHRRRQPRAAVTLDCILTRAVGGPIRCHTLDVGPGGMRVHSDRPLGVDEVLHFVLPVNGGQVDGDARVLRSQGPNVYALRIETLPEEAAATLTRLAA